MAEEEKNEAVTSTVEQKNEAVTSTVEDQKILSSDSTVSLSAEDKNEENCNKSPLKQIEENCNKSTIKKIEENCDRSTIKETEENCDKSTIKETEENCENCDKSTIKKTEENCDKLTLNEIEENCDRSTIKETEENCDTSTIKETEENCDNSTLKEIEETCECEQASSSKAIIASTPSSSSFKFGLLDLVTQIDPKSHPLQWCGFLRKLTKVPSASLLAVNPYLPSLPSIKRTKKKPSRKHTLSMPDVPSTLDPNLYCFEPSWTIYSLSDLKNATNNFNHENLIGEGGYSEVFKGNLQDGQIIAVKRLIRGTQEEMTSDFLSELGILVHVNHPNISNVIGYGVEGGMYLVLPLSHHGSLASLLSGHKEKLNWRIRYNIALGTASGLSYLHEGCQRRIIHRDIKAANILLSEDFEPRIADFGLAKWLPDQWTHLNVSQFEGTFGYLAPEVFMNGLIDEKTDVYAYGVLLLEIITGRPALDEAQKSLVMWARPLINEKDIEKLVDPHLDGECELEQLSDMLWIASQCISQCPTERPKMSQVYRMLSGDEGIPDSKKFMKWAAFRRRKKSTEVFEELLKVKDHPHDQSDGVLED